MSATTEETQRFNAENATSVATDFLKRLGYKHGMLPKKVSLTDEIYVVEIDVAKKAAKVQIDSKTKEIREYEIGEAESSGGSGSRIKIFSAIIPIIAVVAALKLTGFF